MIRSLPLLAAAFVVLWSAGFVGADLGTRSAGFDTLLMWRMDVAAVILLLVCVATGRRLTRDALRRHVPLGVALQFVYLWGVFFGVQLGVTAATAALVAACQPVLVSLAVSRFGSAGTEPEPLTTMRVVGLALGLAGVVLVVGTDLTTGAAPAWAYALPVAAMLSLAAGTFAAGRRRDPTDLITGLTIQTVTAGACFTLGALCVGHAVPPHTWAFAGAVAWVVVLAGFGGYGTYLLLIRSHGPSVASVLLYLTPPTTALWTAVMFGEPLSAVALLGMAVSGAGVTLFLRR